MIPSLGAWTAWKPLPLSLSPSVLAETLDGGQSFRWSSWPGAEWLGVWSDCAARLRAGSEGGLEGSYPSALANRAEAGLRSYLCADLDFNSIARELPWRTDPHLKHCLDAFPGLRILRQPLGETLLGFICSATKQIVQIKQMLALVAERHGAALAKDPESPADDFPRNAPALRRLPTWEEIAELKEADLRSCLLGFRARHVHGTARFLASHPGWLEETATLPYPEAKERLLLLPGVGAKIADCVLLFGAGKLEAFPVDVWILRTMASRYGLDGWAPAHVAQFGRAHFGPLAGLAQQYLFAWERKVARDARPAKGRI